jgi:hypothetical protein
MEATNVLLEGEYLVLRTDPLRSSRYDNTGTMNAGTTVLSPRTLDSRGYLVLVQYESLSSYSEYLVQVAVRVELVVWVRVVGTFLEYQRGLHAAVYSEYVVETRRSHQKNSVAQYEGPYPRALLCKREREMSTSTRIAPRGFFYPYYVMMFLWIIVVVAHFYTAIFFSMLSMVCMFLTSVYNIFWGYGLIDNVF